MSSPRARHAAAGAVAAAAAWLAFYAAWLVIAPGGERALLVFSDTAYLVPIAAAVLLSGWAATRVPKGLRGFWALSRSRAPRGSPARCSGACSSSATRRCPFPWWTDVAYVGFYVLILAALVAFFRPSLRTIGGQAILDGLLAVASLGLLWWGLVLRDLRLGSDPAALVGLSLPGFRPPPPLHDRGNTSRLGAAWHARRLAGRCGRCGRWDRRRRVRAARPHRPLQLWPIRRPRLAAAGVPDLPRRGRCGVRHRPRPGLGAAAVATPDPHGGEHERRADRDLGGARRPRARATSRRRRRCASSSSLQRCC